MPRCGCADASLQSEYLSCNYAEFVLSLLALFKYNSLIFDLCFLFIGGSLAKVAYLSEVKRIRPRHYSRNGSFIGQKSPSNSDSIAAESDGDKQVKV